jgi:hypothetical protein
MVQRAALVSLGETAALPTFRIPWTSSNATAWGSVMVQRAAFVSLGGLIALPRLRTPWSFPNPTATAPEVRWEAAAFLRIWELLYPGSPNRDRTAVPLRSFDVSKNQARATADRPAIVAQL